MPPPVMPTDPGTPANPLVGTNQGQALNNRYIIAERLYNQIEREIGGARDFREMVAVLANLKKRANDIDLNLRPTPDMLIKIENGLYFIISIIAPLAKVRDINGLENVLNYLVSSDTLEFPTTDGKKIELKNNEASLGILEKIRVILAEILAKHYMSSRTDLDPFPISLEEEFRDMGGLA